MGFGIPLEIAELWDDFELYEDYINKDEEYAWFAELPDWAYVKNDGPFYIDPETGNIYGFTVNLSIDGELIGRLAD